MSQQNNPTPVSTPPVDDPADLDQHQPLEPYQRYPELSEEECRAIESKARQEIALIEYQARQHARIQFPFAPLPRAQSNIRSVKRSRLVRKEVERDLTDKIREKDQRNRELDRLIEIELQRFQTIKKKLEEVQKLPDLEPDSVQHQQDSPQNVMDQFLARLDPDDADTLNDTQQPLQRPAPDTHFDEQFGDLTNALHDFHLFANTSDVENDLLQDCEPVPDPRYPLDPLSDPPEELEPIFLTAEHEPHEEDPENHHLEDFSAENSELDNEEPNNPAHQEVF